MFKPLSLSLFVPIVAASLVACGDDTEPTTFTVTIDNISPAYDFSASGAFDTPVGASEPSAIGPGQAYEAEFAAAPGSYLSFATMFVQSNDYFYGPGEDGIALYDTMGMAISGDVTDSVYLWDAGTEVNQEPGTGADQPMHQSGPNSGAVDPDDTVRMASDTFANLPDVSDVVAVTLTPAAGNMFTLRIENVSTAQTLVYTGGESGVVLAPGVWVVHNDPAPLFTVASSDRGVGLEAIAEDGNPSVAATALASATGISGPIAPGVYAVHEDGEPLFSSGAADRGLGLEAVAEDGDPSALATALAAAGLVASGAFTMPVGASAAAPVFTGESYSFTITAMPGDRLSLATMLVQSNDLFFAFAPSGVALFDGADMPLSADLSAQLTLWDAGTEVNEYPGAGPNQAPRQAGPNTGSEESGEVGPVDDGYSYPLASDYIRVSVTAQ